MKIEHELLELAAKAAGYEYNKLYFDPREGILVWRPPHYESNEWNPLVDDGQALRLAVKLKIDIKQYDDYVVGWFDGGYIGTGKIMYDGDPYAATRRAIVRAAAAIGEDLQ